MIKYLFKFLFLSFIVFISCEDVEVAYPGNNQDLEPKPPKGDIIWAIPRIDGVGQLNENSAYGLTIGELEATDPNPDDDFTFTISSQTLAGGGDVSYFNISAVDSLSITNLILINGDIDYEALSTNSKTVNLVIRVEDDSPNPQTSDFTLDIAIVSVNEAPVFESLNSVVRNADEYIEYESQIIWDDVDDGDNPTLTHTGPDWLNVSSTGLLSGIPDGLDVSANSSFVFTITDEGGLSASTEIDIQVRANSAPSFTNESSFPSEIRVGCFSNQDVVYDLNWIDENSGLDNVEFNCTEDIDWLSVDENGVFRMVRDVSNEDANTYEIILEIMDDRPENPLGDTLTIDFTLRLNNAPQFLNLETLQTSMSVADGPVTLEVEFIDLDEDPIAFSLLIDGNLSTYSYYNWITVDNSGDIILNPSTSNTGTYVFLLSVSDGCLGNTADEINFTITN